jgi:hypothetical protein
MLYPSLMVDNFFEDPEKIVNFSKTLEFKEDLQGRYPGTRTEAIHSLNKNFFLYVTRKIMSILYPLNYGELSWTSKVSFQKVPLNVYKNEGWIHNDGSFAEFTSIIYLSDHKNCGTSLYEPINFNNDMLHTDEKVKFYKKIIKEENIEALQANNNQFNKTFTFNSKFNRMILFDSSYWHAADKFGDNINNDDRLTLTLFFSNIKSDNLNIKYPLSEMRRIQ